MYDFATAPLCIDEENLIFFLSVYSTLLTVYNTLVLNENFSSISSKY
jgi:hypothetical protein